MDIYYLSEDIFIEDNKTYYLKNNRKYKVTKLNWHKILNKVGWEKLHIQWIKLLNKTSYNPPKNSLFGEIDCGGKGDCFFNCISYALNSTMDNDQYYTSNILRDRLSKSISYSNYNEMVNMYKIYYDNDDFDEEWYPYTITYDQFINIIKSSNTWGDYLLLDKFINLFNINIIILYVNTIHKEYYVYNTLHRYNPANKTIILNYFNEIHFTLVGYFNSNKMVTLFKDNTLPKEISNLLKKNKFL